jgi:glutamate-1-semialdehyde aminotransferase
VRRNELLFYNGGMTSAAHGEQDIDDTVAAFDDLVAELLGRDTLAHR